MSRPMLLTVGATVGAALGALLALFRPETAAGQEVGTGRDFPKTLTFDEPGIDDEVSLPTLIATPHGVPPGDEIDLDFELDKRLTRWLSVQINTGYTALQRPAARGWQNVDATLKTVVLADRAAERLVSVSLTREFGGFGATRIGAAPVSASTAAINFGQGFSTLTRAPLWQPLAITGSVGYLLPDAAGGASVQQALTSVSLQYSFDVLMSGAPAGQALRLPSFMRPFIPILECVYAQPVTGHEARHGTLAPGLIYAGDGYQLAAEMLVPLTKASGIHVGFIAQLNISLSTFGLPALARPLF